MQNPFDHPDHRDSETLAYEAEVLLRAGQIDEASAKYEAAGQRELLVARSMDHPKLRAIFAISAAACFVHGRKWEDAARVAHEFLAHPERLVPDGARELEDLLDQALRSRELASVFGDGGLVPLEIRLEGGLVKRGLAPTKLIQEREEVAEALLLRIAEWKSGLAFRERGSSVLAANMHFYEAPARAASYGIRLFVGASGQTDGPGSGCSPKEAVSAFLGLAAELSAGVDIREVVHESRYAMAFARAFRDLAPDGSRLGSVTFMSTGTLFRQPTVSFDQATRVRLSQSLAHTGVEPVEVTGTLRVVSLKQRYVIIDASDGAHRFRLRPGEHDDTIGPKLNRRVHVVGQRDLENGTIYATDVELLGG